MKKTILIALILLIILSYINIISSNVIVPFDNKILNERDSTWIEPYKFYNSGTISNIMNDEIEIDIGVEDGIHEGFVYYVFSKGIQIGQMIITKVKNDHSIGVVYENDKDFREGDKVRFADLIDVSANLSYSRRYYKKVESKITFIDDSGLAFIAGDKNSGIKKGVHFDVFNANDVNLGVLEILDDSGKDNIIVAQVINSTGKISINDKVISRSRNPTQWVEFGTQLEKDEKNIEDAIFAYEMALTLGGEPKSFIKNKLLDLVLIKSKQYENKEEFDKSLVLRKKVLGFTKEADDEYYDLKEKVRQLAKEYWSDKFYLQCIKYYEVLDQDDQIKKFISLSYNGLGAETMNSNNELSYYCFDKAIKLLPNNTKARENLAKWHEKQKDYKKAIEILSEMMAFFTVETEKKIIRDKIAELEAQEQKIFINVTMHNLDGKIINLQSFRGSIVLLVLWRRNNRASDDNLEFLNEYMANKGRNRLKVFLINNEKENLDENIIKNYFIEKEITSLEPVIPEGGIFSVFPDQAIINRPLLNIILDSKGRLIYQEEEVFGDEIERVINNLQ
ncbi:hypothetical protein HZA55_08515 [Candidatus Poribacteria bacterium]|nr:hypothetical protein [Candidatus Poribacteria bacterium]